MGACFLSTLFRSAQHAVMNVRARALKVASPCGAAVAAERVGSLSIGRPVALTIRTRYRRSAGYRSRRITRTGYVLASEDRAALPARRLLSRPAARRHSRAGSNPPHGQSALHAPQRPARHQTPPLAAQLHQSPRSVRRPRSGRSSARLGPAGTHPHRCAKSHRPSRLFRLFRLGRGHRSPSPRT
jgi:hypothetical protein